MKSTLLAIAWIFVFCLAAVPAFAKPGVDGLVGEYALTRASLEALENSDVDPATIQQYRTLYVLNCVNGLQVETQASPGAPIEPVADQPGAYRNRALDIHLHFTPADGAEAGATRLSARQGDFRAEYRRVHRGPGGVDRPDEVFPVRTPSAAGLNPAPLNDGLAAIRDGRFENIHGLLVVKDGHILAEEYFNGSNARHRHDIRSSGKSVASLIIGIAIDRGLVSSEDEKVFSLFPDREPVLGWGRLRERMTLRHVLTMTSGQACDDWQAPRFHCEREMWRSADWLGFAINLPMAHAPGEHWAYSSATLMLLTGVIRRVSGQSYQDFAQAYLFDPLGIERPPFFVSPQGDAFPSGSVKFTARELVRIGQMVLQDGEWQGRRVISADWIKRSTAASVTASGHYPYGYLWWRGEKRFGQRLVKMFYAAGNGGNNLFVFPDLDMVVVLTGGNYESGLTKQVFGILAKHIVPAALAEPSDKYLFGLSKSSLKAYAGTYENNRIQFEIRAKELQLYLRVNNRSWNRLLSVSDSEFRIPDRRYDDALVRFVPRSDGGAYDFEWNKYWRTFTAVRAR